MDGILTLIIQMCAGIFIGFCVALAVIAIIERD